MVLIISKEFGNSHVLPSTRKQAFIFATKTLCPASSNQQLHLTYHLGTKLYSKCPKILYIKILTKWHGNNAYPDQTAQAVRSRVYIVCHSTRYFDKQLHRKQNLGKKVCNIELETLGHLPYTYMTRQGKNIISPNVDS